MSKRKLAVAMAGAMVATAVVPAFAAEAENIVKKTISRGEESKKLVSDLRKLLADSPKFDEAKEGVVAKGESVYDVKIDGVSTTNMLSLETAIENLEEGNFLTVTVVDKGFVTRNGKIVQEGEAKDIASIKVEAKSKEGVVKTYEIADFYDGKTLTNKGYELAAIVSDKYKNDEFTATKKGDITINDKKDAIEIVFEVVYVDQYKDKEDVKVVIKGKDLGHLESLKDILNGFDSNAISKLAGKDRYETAVEIAKANTKANEEYKNIVLVSGTSLIDGLTAAPYAAKEKANVLLTAKDEVPQSTLEYIIESGQKEVTVIGGESVVSRTVVSQLNAKGIKVNRIAGQDRHETSLEVAKKMDSSADAFVVAATGEADAMSIAPVAVRDGRAIIVEGFSGISNYAKSILNNREIEVIGGNVTEGTKKELNKLDKSGKIEVVSGVDRFETNAKVINKHYAGKNVNNVYVAKDGYTEADNAVLVDALAVGVLAGEEVGPVVLASEKLSTKQSEALKLSVVKDSKDNKVIQVGNGVKDSAVKEIAKLLGLIK